MTAPCRLHMFSSAIEIAAARRDGMDWVIREQCCNRCEDCGQSVRGLAVFECTAKRGSTSLYCCASCANLVDVVRGLRGVTAFTKPSTHWTKVVLVRSGLSGAWP